MSGGAYYNEIDPYAASWLRNLVAAGLIAPGDVDERSIVDVQPGDLAGYTQCHFFAGIGGWSYALRLAGWPDDRPVWTGSCPCQPFSAAGKRRGQSDERDLWPAFFRLIDACRPVTVFGEQVASSLILGRSRDEDMHGVWNRKTFLGISEWLEGSEISTLQGLRPRCSDGIAQNEASHYAGQQKMASQKSRLGVDIQRPRQSKGQRASSRRHISGNTGSGNGGLLRSHRYSIRFDEIACMELPFVGSDCAGERIYARQYQGGHLCLQCDGECLGGTEDFECGGCFAEAETGELRRLLSEIRRDTEEEYRPEWITRIRFDLERGGYTFGASILPAAGAGAPHIRQRLFWVADAASTRAGRNPGARDCPQASRESSGHRDGDGGNHTSVACGDALWVADTSVEGWGGQPGRDDRQDGRTTPEPRRLRDAGGLGDADIAGLEERAGEPGDDGAQRPPAERTGGDVWSGAEWLLCLDGKARRVEPPLQSLVDGISFCLGHLCPEWKGEIGDASESSGIGVEVLRALRQGYHPETIWQSLGRRIGFSEATLLFAVLCERSGELGDIVQRKASGLGSIRKSLLRELHRPSSAPCPSSGWQPAQQCAIEFADALRELSPATSQVVRGVLAALRSFTGSPLATDVPARVGKLRAAGNAIVPQITVEFVKAVMDMHP